MARQKIEVSEENIEVTEETLAPTAEEVVAPKAPKVLSKREELWAEYVANYKIKNPVKAAAKEANGEFRTPPVSFLGIKEVHKSQNGQVSTIIR